MEKVLCLIDIQREYNTEGRAFFIPELQRSLSNAQNVLKHARNQKWPIVHVQHLQEKGIFAKGNPLADFIEGFEPLKGEAHVTKGDFSSFSSPEFTEFLKAHKDKEILVVGYGSTMCCLSTIVDGYHRGYKFQLLTDATAAKPTPNYSTDDLHRAACEILGTFCKLTKTAELC